MQSRRIQISHTHGDQKAGFTKQLETNHNNTLKRRGNIGKDCSVCVDKVGSEKSKWRNMSVGGSLESGEEGSGGQM